MSDVGYALPGKETQRSGPTTESPRTGPDIEPAPSNAQVAAGMATSADPAELDEATAYLQDVVESILDIRAATADRMFSTSEPADVPNWFTDVVVPVALTAVGMATAGIGGVAAASVTKLVVDPKTRPLAAEFIKSAFKDVVDAQLQEHISSGIETATSGWADSGDAREAYFTGLANGLRSSVPDGRSVAHEDVAWPWALQLGVRA